ncbi:MAG: LamG domain-containing protein [Microscillaceae bacterium]|nr:LamG domain-containing protein [Microscillaceae bacterium]
MDGNLDLAFVYAGMSQLSVHLGNGNGTFGSPLFFSVEADPDYIAVGDFDNDNLPDIVTGHSNYDYISVLLNKSPFLAADQVSLSGFVADASQVSHHLSFKLTAKNLVGDVNVNVSGSDWELSLDNFVWSDALNIPQTSGNLINNPTQIYVRLKSSLSLGNKLAALTISTMGASNKTIQLGGRVIYQLPIGFAANMLAGNGTINQVAVGNAVDLQFEVTQSFSLETWFKTTSANGGLFKKVNPTTELGYLLEIVAGKIVFKLTHHLPTSNSLSITTNQTFNDGRWHHIVATYNGNSDVSGVKIFVDGFNQSVTTNSNNLSGNIVNSEPLLIGESLDGYLEELKIWNIELNQAQVRQFMSLTLAGSENGLIGYWQFNETSGLAVDKIKGNNGTLSAQNTRVISDLAVGKGVSKIVQLGAVGIVGLEVDDSITNLAIDFVTNGVAPDGEIVIFQLYSLPVNNVLETPETSSNYWIIRNFGSNNSNLDINTIKFKLPETDFISANDANNPNNLKLYKRGSTDDLATDWAQIGAGILVNEATKEITFDASAIKSFSQFISSVSSSNPLPVEFRYFDAHRTSADKVLLSWQTSYEHNNQGFVVEQSENNHDFSAVGYVERIRDSNTRLHYSFVVYNSKPAYYRLKQLDFDGKYSFTHTRFVGGDSVNKIYFYPNPTQNQLNIKGDILADEWLHLQINNSNGLKIWEAKGKLSTINLNLHQITQQLSAGTYIFYLKTPQNMIFQKIVKY